MTKTSCHSLIFGLAKSIGICYLLFVLFFNGLVIQGLMFMVFAVLIPGLSYVVDFIRSRRTPASADHASNNKQELAEKVTMVFAEKMGGTFAVMMIPAMAIMFVFESKLLVVASWVVTFVAIIGFAIYLGKRHRQSIMDILNEPSDKIHGSAIAEISEPRLGIG